MSTSTSENVLGLPPSFTTVGLYSKTSKIQLPISSIEEEFKVSKVRYQMMLRDTPDKVIQEAKPELKTGKKWTPSKAITEAESNLRFKEICGATQVGRAGLGQSRPRWFSKQSTTGAREMVTDEIRHMEEETRQAISVGFAKQCAWTKWEDAEPKKITWPTFFTIEPLRLSFLLRSTYDLLPSPANLRLWGMTDDDICKDCGTSRATLAHTLSSCTKSLQKYTWRHNQVLEIIVRVTKEQCEMNTEGLLVGDTGDISFVEEGKEPRPPRQLKYGVAKLFGDCLDWKILADLEEKMVFPQHIAVTNLRPDIVIWSDEGKQVHLVELTVPWEDHLEEAFERKKTKYETLRADCETNGWHCNVVPVEIGCRGYTAKSLSRYLRGIVLKGITHNKTIEELEAAAETASSWIWQASRQHFS